MDNTPELIVEAGLLYHCDYHDDEMPYPLKVGDKVLIEFPHQYTINDHRMIEHGWSWGQTDPIAPTRDPTAGFSIR